MTVTLRPPPQFSRPPNEASALPAERGAGAPQPTLRSQIATFVVVGLVGGVLSGLFAIGGGILMVPLLVWRARMDQRRAAATSLIAIIPTAAVSSAVYLSHGYVDVVAGALVAVGAVVGAVLGSRLLTRLPVARLRWIFIAFIVVVAVRLLLVAPSRGHAVPLTLLVVLGYIAVGLTMGVASGLFGIGGGIVAVPLLVSVFGVGDLIAKGTALLVSIPTSVAGTVSNRRRGLITGADVRDGLIVGTAAAVASIPAVYLAVTIPADISGMLFAALLLAVAAQLTAKAVRQPS